QLTEDVAVAQPSAAVVQRDLRRIVGHTAPGAEADGVTVRAAEVVEPESRVKLAGVILDQGELRPAHRAVHPARGGGDGGAGGHIASSAKVTAAPAMLHVFRNTLREKSSCMLRTSPPGQGWSGRLIGRVHPAINVTSRSGRRKPAERPRCLRRREWRLGTPRAAGWCAR